VVVVDYLLREDRIVFFPLSICALFGDLGEKLFVIFKSLEKWLEEGNVPV
jgi:hypothetical protein